MRKFYGDVEIKNNLEVDGSVTLTAITASRVLTSDSSGVITASATTATELGYVSGVTSAIQTQLDAKASIAYVDAAIAGLKWKAPVRVIATTNTALTGGASLSIDGVSLANTDRLLLAGQTSAADNGIYVVSGIGSAYSLTRSSDADASSEILQMAIFVEEGSSYADTAWVCTADAPITLGSTALPFVQFSGAGSIIAGAGLTKTGNTLDVNATDASILVGADSLAVQRDAAGAVGLSGSGVVVNVDGSTIEITTNALQLKNTAVSAGSYGSATQVGTFTVNAKGQLTAASNASIAITSAAVTDFVEAAQDAVGGALTDTASVDFTYNDAGNTISAVVLPAGVDHDQLLNYVANKHIDHSAVTISGASNGGLAGGGDITASRTLSVDITNAVAETSADNADQILIYDNSATALRKMSRANFLSGISSASPGDINETSFSLANNQASPANVTGFAFANAVVRGFTALVTVYIDATSDLFEEFTIQGINKGTVWAISVDSVGDDSGVLFTITNAGQIQYTSTNVSGFSSGTMKFRALTTSV